MYIDTEQSLMEQDNRYIYIYIHIYRHGIVSYGTGQLKHQIVILNSIVLIAINYYLLLVVAAIIFSTAIKDINVLHVI